MLCRMAGGCVVEIDRRRVCLRGTVVQTGTGSPTDGAPESAILVCHPKLLDAPLCMGESNNAIVEDKKTREKLTGAFRGLFALKNSAKGFKSAWE
ncbi:hypothetical protein [Caballeronia sp. ATUFL_M2_KS44]|uniref:hypothetical protein n=1 Tax=Caballeronia sp. ATUFL_M2_KS44 TaxID=2921767 RepID=UPI0020298E67|nr:hypothetical protein [Caballeronia sp. ATUFL_M2_KS44]